MKTIFSWCLTPRKENKDRNKIFYKFSKTVKKLLNPRYIREGVVIFIVIVSILITHTIAGSFGFYPVDEESTEIRRGSSLYASQYLNPEEIILEEVYADAVYFENQNMVLQSCAFISPSSPSTITAFLGEERSGIINYKVQPGDVPSQIASAFGISTNTLLWANSLSVWDYIKPGQELIILPVSGISHVAKKGETLEKIVNTYKGDVEKTIDFNGLPADGTLVVGQEIIIPNGQKQIYYSQTASYATSYNFPRPYSGQSHQFPWGQCTWYVAQRRYVPWSGHAKSWLYNAKQYGFATGGVPKPGAIMQTREGGYYGHVAYVEAMSGNYVTISEMHLGYGVRKVRTLHKDDWRIIGYIY